MRIEIPKLLVEYIRLQDDKLVIIKDIPEEIKEEYEKFKIEYEKIQDDKVNKSKETLKKLKKKNSDLFWGKFILVMFVIFTIYIAFTTINQKNLIKNGIKLQATVTEVNNRKNYDGGDYYFSTDIYIEYEIDNVIYENSIIDYGGAARKGEIITIYCDKDDHTNITTKEDVSENTFFLVALCVYVAGCTFFLIITIIEQKEREKRKNNN